MFIDVSSIIQAWSLSAGWMGGKIKINEKGLATIKAQ